MFYLYSDQILKIIVSITLNIKSRSTLTYLSIRAYFELHFFINYHPFILNIINVISKKKSSPCKSLPLRNLVSSKAQSLREYQNPRPYVPFQIKIPRNQNRKKRSRQFRKVARELPPLLIIFKGWSLWFRPPRIGAERAKSCRNKSSQRDSANCIYHGNQN